MREKIKEIMEDVKDSKLFDKIETYYYNTKYTIVNFFKFAKIVSCYRPWDYQYITEMMEFQLKDLCNNIEKNGIEVDEYRLPKIEKMKHTIELLHNHNEDNYIDRSGYIQEATRFNFSPHGDGCKQCTLEKVPGYENYDEHKVFADARELEEKEWNELFEVLKDLRSWWD